MLSTMNPRLKVPVCRFPRFLGCHSVERGALQDTSFFSNSMHLYHAYTTVDLSYSARNAVFGSSLQVELMCDEIDAVFSNSDCRDCKFTTRLTSTHST